MTREIPLDLDETRGTEVPPIDNNSRKKELSYDDLDREKYHLKEIRARIETLEKELEGVLDEVQQTINNESIKFAEKIVLLTQLFGRLRDALLQKNEENKKYLEILRDISKILEKLGEHETIKGILVEAEEIQGINERTGRKYTTFLNQFSRMLELGQIELAQKDLDSLADSEKD